MGFIDISIGDFVLSKTEQADVTADATGFSVELGESGDADEQPADDERAKPTDESESTDESFMCCGRGGCERLNVSCGRVALLGLGALGLAVGLALASKRRQKS